MNDKRIKILSEEAVVKAIFKMSLPVVCGMMVQVLYNLVDTFFIGKLNDPNQLAAANISTPVFMILMALSGIIGTGAASYVSRCLGSKDYEEGEKTLSTGIGICVFMSFIVTIVGSIYVKPIIGILGASDMTFGFAYDYVSVLLFGSVAIMCNFSMGQLMRSEGDAMGSMLGMFIGTVVNIILDPVFIFTFNMGIKGAALATVIGNGLGALYYIYRYSSGKTILKINVKKITFNKKIWKEIFVIGTPATLSQILMSFAMIISNNIAASYSDIIVASMGVSSKIMTIGTFIFMGFAAGCQPLVGYNYGANNFKRVLEVVKKAVIITGLIGIALFITFWFFAPTIIAIFIKNTEVIETGSIILRALIFSLPFVGGQMICMTTVQAMGKGLPALFLSVARQGILYIPILFILNKLFQFNGFIYAQPITDTIMIGISSFVLYRIIKKDIIYQTFHE